MAGGVARCACTEEGEEVVVGPATLPHYIHLLQERHRGSISSDLFAPSFKSYPYLDS